MKLQRVLCVGALALLRATCAASSCSDGGAVSGGKENENQGRSDESANAHCAERVEDPPLMTFAHDWTMTPARFVDYVGGHDVCPDTIGGRNAEKDNCELGEEAVDGGNVNMTSATDDTSGVDAANDGFEGPNADDSGVDEPGKDLDGGLDAEAVDAGDETLARSTDAASGDVKLAGTVESVLKLQKRWRMDPPMRVTLVPGSGSESATLQMTERLTTRSSRSWPTTVVQLSAGTQVRAVAVDAFAVSTSKGSWAFTTRDRALRDVWIAELLNATEQTGHTSTFDEDGVVSGKASAAGAGNPSDIINFKTPLKGMQPREVTLAGSSLTVCKLTEDGSVTKSCEEINLDSSYDAVPVTIKRGRGRAFFKVTTDASRSTKSWTFNAGSPDAQARWIELIKGAVREAKGDEGTDEEDETKAFSEALSMEPGFRGWKLGPKDPPLEPGMFLSNLNPKQPAALEVTQIGDILISAGVYPDRTQDPTWAFRNTGPSNIVNALGCSVEAFRQRLSSTETQVNLSVKNGRWRMSWGMMCTLGRSPAPEGSLRRFLPWDKRGRDIANAELQMADDGTAMIRTDDTVLWDSYWAYEWGGEELMGTRPQS